MKILLHTPVSQATGYGRDGIGLARALLDRGHDVRLAPSFVGVPIPRDVANLLTQPLDPPFDVALHHIEANKAGLQEADALMARRNVLWTMWDWPLLPVDEEWVQGFSEATRRFDFVVAYTDTGSKAFEPYTGAERLRTVLGGYESSLWEPPTRDKAYAAEPYTFGMAGRLTVRKGVYTTYRAFLLLREQHGEDFKAHLALQSIEQIFPPGFPVDERVHQVIGRLDPERMREFYWGVDTLVCPSWAESKHLPPIEALSCGTPVILSDIPGHRAWALSDMVTWARTEVKYLQAGAEGGYVSPEDLAAAMWSHYADRPTQRLKASLAARTLPSMLDWSKAVERLGLATGILL